MKLLLTNVSRFQGKDGRWWLKVSGLLQNGETVSGTIMPAPDETPVVNLPDIVDAVSALPVYDIQFNQQGRVQALTPDKD